MAPRQKPHNLFLVKTDLLVVIDRYDHSALSQNLIQIKSSEFCSICSLSDTLK